MKKPLGFLIGLLLTLGATAPAWAAHSVTLTWTASADSSASIGYNVYRGTATGAESTTALNSSPVAVNCSGATCTYTDSVVTAGGIYYYVVKAVNTTTNVLSPASNEVSATVPIAAPTGLTEATQ